MAQDLSTDLSNNSIILIQMNFEGLTWDVLVSVT